MFRQRFDIGQRSNLFHRFLAASAVAILLSMALIAYFMSRQLEVSMMETASEEGAILIDVFLGPSLQELATASTLSPDVAGKLDDLLKTTIGERTKALKVWLRDGTLVYATNKQLVGRKFPSQKLDESFAGAAFGSFAKTDDEAHLTEQKFEKPLIEIYAPIYRTGTREIIAVGEVYNSGARLAAELRAMRWTAVGIVGAITAPMISALLLIVWRTRAIVRRQQLVLHQRVDEARAMAKQNEQLRQASETIQVAAMHSNEQLLGQIGQDLHDGPVQLVGILALKLSEFADRQPRDGELISNVTELTAALLKELRDISTGLVLPELDNLNCAETLRLAVNHHERNTGTRVACNIEAMSFRPDLSLQVCMFRVVQECLNNAYAHGDGREQQVAASESTSTITIIVDNALTVHPAAKPSSNSGTGLGLPGLRRRVLALGGTFDAQQNHDRMIVTVELPKRILQTKHNLK